MALSLVEHSLDDLLRSTYHEIQNSGVQILPTRGAAREIVGVCLELTDPRARLSRTETRRREVSTIAELCWYMSGSKWAAPITFYLKQYATNAEEDGTIHGAYGPRLFGGVNFHGRLRTVVDSLKSNADSRRAVVQIFDHTDHSGTRFRDVPCTLTMQFLLRNNKVHMVVNMRSNDALIGLPHDVFAFTMIQELVARSLDVEVGRYIQMVGSLHLYDGNQNVVERFLGEGWQSNIDPMPPMPPGDPWGQVSQLLTAEAQIRQLREFKEIDLPTEDYWADFARVLAAWVAKKKLNQTAVASMIRAEISLTSFRDFI